MNRRRALLTAFAAPLAGCAARPPIGDPAQLRKEVTDTELAFAKTMADRNHAAFVGFVAEEAIFLNAGKPLHGRDAIAAHWKRFYAAPEAPFSWRPEYVEVLPSGTLAQSVGPVMDPSGTVFARFHSVWRLETPGVWRIVFDDGTPVCRDAKASSRPSSPQA